MFHRTRFIALALLASVVACHDTTTPFEPITSVSALWTTQTVNGAALPFTVQQFGNNKEELLSRVYGITVTSTAGGTFTQSATERFTQNGQVSTVSGTNAGTFTITGTTLHFVYTGTAAMDSARWDGHDQLTLFDGPNTFVLTR